MKIRRVWGWWQVTLKVTKKFHKILLLVMYFLNKFDDVIKCGFWVLSEIISANLYKLIQDIMNYPTFIYPFELGKCGEEPKK